VRKRINSLSGNRDDKSGENYYPLNGCMKRRNRKTTATEAQRWARRLSQRVEKVLAAHPDADRDNVRHTLILLEQPPLERLQRSLLRGRATSILRK
jgi:hypothetical protein